MYLDIDGVLNSSDDYGRKREWCLDGNKNDPHWLIRFSRGDWVECDKWYMLQQFIYEHDIKVVIVSSWCGGGTDYKSVHEFLDYPEHSKAYCTNGGLERGENVIKHAHDHGISPDDYVIVDDSWRQMYTNWERLIRVDSGVGLTEYDIEIMKELYGIE